MNPWVALLGGGTGATLALGVIDRVRNAKFDRRKQDSGIHLDDATYKEIASRAEQTNQTGLMAVGAFWAGQFNEVQTYVNELADWQRRARKRMHIHREWDKRLINGDPDPGPPPPLDPDDDS